MADQAIKCAGNQNISLTELMNSILVRKKSTGEIGLRRLVITADADDIEAYNPCAGGGPPLSRENILRFAFGLTDTGETGLVFIEENP